MKLYDTFKERATLAILKILFPEDKWIVINPAKLRFSHKIDPMPDYINYMKKCDLLLVQEYDGFLGKGVFLEYNAAIENNIETYLIRDIDTRLLLYKIKKVNIFNPDDIKYKFAKILEIVSI